MTMTDSTREAIKQAALAVLEEGLRDYPILGGAAGWDGLDPKDRERLLDGLADDIAGKVLLVLM